MLNFILKGGLLMGPILFCSILSITLILERFYFFHKTKSKIPNLFSRVRNLLKYEKTDEALKLCESAPGHIGHILAIAIHIRRKSEKEKERIIAQACSKIIRKLEKNLDILAVIANVTPLLGLLGTVTGMIKAFMKIQDLKGTVDVAILAGGIWEALITTAAGLSVAIPAMVFHHYFETKTDNIIKDMKEAGSIMWKEE